LATIICSCSDNDSWADNYITNLAEINTDHDGIGTTMRTDNGSTYILTNAINLGRPDTTYRCICIYTLNKTNAKIADYAKTFSSLPITDTTGIKIKRDPCQIQSIWLSGNYLNARMLVQGKDIPHVVGFIDNGIRQNPDGSNTLDILLHHDQNNDQEAFTRTIYLSMPLKGYAGKLQSSRDSVCLIAPQQTYTVAY